MGVKDMAAELEAIAGKLRAEAISTDDAIDDLSNLLEGWEDEGIAGAVGSGSMGEDEDEDWEEEDEDESEGEDEE